MSTDWSDIDNRLLDPHWYVTEDYHEVFARLRREDPVHWTENDWYGRHHWTLTRHDHIKEYLLNHEMYSSRWDTRVPVSPKRRTPEVRHAQGWDVGVGTTDNPLHDLYRRPINKHFSVPAIGRMREDIESLVDEILGEVAGNGSCDIVADVAG